MAQNKKKRRCFTLINVNPLDLYSRYEHYNFIKKPNIEMTLINTEDDDDISTTELMHEKNKRVKKHTFILDSSKNKIKYWINMYDLTTNCLLPRYTKLPCWFCRETFTTHPMGCPIEYHATDVNGKLRKLCQDNNIHVDKDDPLDYFETEGIFDTGPCIKAYIITQLSITKSPIYKRALGHLTLMCQKFFGDDITDVPVADTWKIGINSGGHLTAQERRAAVGKLVYNETVNVRRPYMLPVNKYIEEMVV